MRHDEKPCPRLRHRRPDGCVGTEAEREVDAELEFHIEERARALMAAGWGKEEARSRAFREFGDYAGTRAKLVASGRRYAVRQRLFTVLEETVRDARLAVRSLGRTPAMAAAAAVVLALGVGANATMAGLVDRLLVRAPEGVVEPDRVVRVYGRNSWTALTRSYPDYLDLRDGARLLSDVAAYRTVTGQLREPVRREIRVGVVTPGFLPLLGVQPQEGRGFRPDEGGGPVAVISHALGRRLFGDTGGLNRDLRVGAGTYRVVGIAPRDFRGVDAERVDVWIPLGELARDRGNFGAVNVIARLAEGATMAAAEREANLVNRAGYVADGLNPEEDVMQLGPLPVTRGPAAPREVRVAVHLALVAVLVLLIAAANVGNLLLARVMSRSGDVRIRRALGASRLRLARQWITEGLVLGIVGGAAALLVVAVAGVMLDRLRFPGMPADMGLDARLMAIVAVSALLTGLACGLGPAVQASSVRMRAPGGRQPMRAVLLGVQVALTAALLVGASLFTRSLENVRSIDLGFAADRLVVVRVVPMEGGMEAAATDAVLRELLAPARRAPGVEAATLTATVPFISGWRTRFYVPGRDPERNGQEGGGRYNRISTFVDAGFLETTGLELLAGRWIEPSDRTDAQPVTVVNDRLAAEVWPGIPLSLLPGECMHVAAAEAPCTRIIGVVRATRVENVFTPAPAQYYLPIDQPRRGEAASAILVRTGAPPGRIAEQLRHELQRTTAAPVEVVSQPLSDAIDPVLRPWELGAFVFSAFGLLALAVSSAGLFGIVGLLVAERTRELGVRRALGASPAHLTRLVVVRVGSPVAIGLAAGLVLGWAASRVGAGLLYGTSPGNPQAHAAATLTLVFVAAIACAVPARRAARVDPAVALRNE